jgi:hypothetical protein
MDHATVTKVVGVFVRFAASVVVVNAHIEVIEIIEST